LSELFVKQRQIVDVLKGGADERASATRAGPGEYTENWIQDGGYMHSGKNSRKFGSTEGSREELRGDWSARSDNQGRSDMGGSDGGYDSRESAVEGQGVEEWSEGATGGGQGSEERRENPVRFKRVDGTKAAAVGLEIFDSHPHHQPTPGYNPSIEAMRSQGYSTEPRESREALRRVDGTRAVGVEIFESEPSVSRDDPVSALWSQGYSAGPRGSQDALTVPSWSDVRGEVGKGGSLRRLNSQGGVASSPRPRSSISSSTYVDHNDPECCPHCGKRVYFAEEVKVQRRKWHRLCFKCGMFSCNFASSVVCLDQTLLYVWYVKI